MVASGTDTPGLARRRALPKMPSRAGTVPQANKLAQGWRPCSRGIDWVLRVGAMLLCDLDHTAVSVSQFKPTGLNEYTKAQLVQRISRSYAGGCASIVGAATSRGG